jgi:hypothetical protein
VSAVLTLILVAPWSTVQRARVLLE